MTDTPGDPPSDPAPSTGLSLTSDERTWALAAHALTFVEGGVLGPLIVYLVKKDDSEFIAFHALQSLLFGLFFTAISVLFIAPLTFCTFGFGALLIFLVLPVYFGFELYAVVKANEGDWYMLPIVGPIALERHPPPPGTFPDYR